MSLVKVLGCLLPLEEMLRGNFDSVAFLGLFDDGTSNGVNRRQQQTMKYMKGDAKVAIEAICSEKFLAYAHMLMAVQSVLGKLVSWCESCPCHHGLGEKWRAKFTKLVSPGLGPPDRNRMHHPCVMSGLLAPELTAGKVDEKIDELSNTGMDHIKAKYNLPPEEFADISGDFGLAKAYLYACSCNSN